MLRLKEEFIGKKVSMQTKKMGQVIFDADEVDIDKYKAYQDMGFDLFEEVKVDKKTKKVKAKSNKKVKETPEEVVNKETTLERVHREVKDYQGVKHDKKEEK